MNDKMKHFIGGFILGFLSLPIALKWGLGWGFIGMPLLSWAMIIGKEFSDKYIKVPATGFDVDDIKAGGLSWFIGWILAGVLFAPLFEILKLLN